MFGIGLPEMILILALALIVVGPDKLPELARSLAKGVMELKKTAEGVKEQLKEETNLIEDVRPDLEDAANTLKSHMLSHPEKGNTSLFGDNTETKDSSADEAAAAYRELTDQGVNPSETPEVESTSQPDGISGSPRGIQDTDDGETMSPVSDEEKSEAEK